MFECAEKRFEVFTCDSASSLRDLGRDFWTDIVHRARAEVVSFFSGQNSDAYLLSESSLFVFPRQVVMLTCGQTALLPALTHLVSHIGKEKVRWLSYEREEEKHAGPQTSSVSDDLQVFSQLFPALSMSTLVTGRGPQVCLAAKEVELQKPLLRAMLEDVDLSWAGPDCLEFSAVGVPLLRGLVSDFLVDDLVFSPFGYSLNALSDSSYAAIHLSRGAESFSLSFETDENPDTGNLAARLAALLRICRPRRYSVICRNWIEPLSACRKMRVFGQGGRFAAATNQGYQEIIGANRTASKSRKHFSTGPLFADQPSYRNVKDLRCEIPGRSIIAERNYEALLSQNQQPQL